MKRSFVIAAAVLLPLISWPASARFLSWQKAAVRASATVASGAQALSIQAVPLNNQVFFGKNVVLGVNVVSTTGQVINTQNLKVGLVYQLVDATGRPLTPPANAPVILQQDPSNPAHLQGTALVPRSDISAVEKGGSVLYYFQALQGTSATVLSKSGRGVFPAPSGTPSIPSSDYFSATVINTQQAAISPAGSVVTLPDTFQFDGQTGLAIPAGAVSAPTRLTIRQADINSLPPGPGGAVAVVAYSVELPDGAQPQRPVQLTLSYPANLNGSLIGSNLSPAVLAPYWYDSNHWQLLSLPHLNSTLHTVTGTTTHFATFALFATGPVDAPALRTAQRIITPNGDGINDTASFGAIEGDLKIFDVHGRRVRTLPGPSPVWDGRDDDGRIVEVGIYLYQYSSQGTRVSGVIAVAK